MVNVMETSFSFVQIPEKIKPYIGKPDPGTRIYRNQGSGIAESYWFRRLMRAFPDGVVSPGGVAMFAPVSRAAVHKALREGRLTAFAFHEVEDRKTLFGGTRAKRQNPYLFIPVVECVAWGEALRKQAAERAGVSLEELEGKNPDWDAWDIVNGPKEFRKTAPRKGKGMHNE
jgi:hypothetical protein